MTETKAYDINLTQGYGRASGRTFRCLLWGLLAASSGKRVLYVVPGTDRRLCNHAWQRALDIGGAYADHIIKNERKIKFANGGSMQVCIAGQITGGVDTNTVFVDDDHSE